MDACLIALEFYNSIFNTTHESNRFELYTHTFDEFSTEELNDELEEIVKFSNTSHKQPQDETIEPREISANKKLETEKRQVYGYYMLIMAFARSPFRAFECCLRTVPGLDEDDVQLILKQYNSNFVTYGLFASIYSIQDSSEVVYTMGDQDETLKNDFDEIGMKTKLVLKNFVGTLGTLRFIRMSFYITLLGFTLHWHYTPANAIHADSPTIYTSEKNSNFSTKKIFIYNLIIITVP